MACLLKLPTGRSKGVITFTTQEWRVMSADDDLALQLAGLRELYITGLHFNWHDYQFKPPPLFDFFMAGSEDLRPVDDTPFRLLPLDACNFTPAAYAPVPLAQKFWDVLIVGNPVFFKRPEVVLETIRKLFDATPRKLTVLYICPIPRYRFADEDTVLYGVRDYYESLFTPEERTRFTLLTTNFDSPNPFDRTTLSVFFRISKVFLHCATEERRCRIAAYAWCAGLPVVAALSVGSILSAPLRTRPGYWCVEDDADYAPMLLAALDDAGGFDASAYREELSEVCTVDKLQAELAAIFAEQRLHFEGELLRHNLDRRLGWHHQGIGGGANGLAQPLDAFMRELATLPRVADEFAQELLAHEYPERLLAREAGSGGMPDVGDVKRRSIYLNPRKKFWFRAFRALKAKAQGAWKKNA